LELAPLGPLVRLVVVVHVAEEEARFAPMNDQADVAAHAYGPKALVPRAINLVQLETRLRRTYLKVERRRLGGLLLIRSEAAEAFRERIRDPELHLRRP